MHAQRFNDDGDWHTHTHTLTHAHWHTKPVYLNRIAHRRYGPDAGPDDKDPP